MGDGGGQRGGEGTWQWSVTERGVGHRGKLQERSASCTCLTRSVGARGKLLRAEGALH